MSALHLACHHGYDKIVQILLEAGAKVDIQDQVRELQYELYIESFWLDTHH